MAYFMTQVKYSPEAWRAWIASPGHSCKAKIEQMAINLGGTLHGIWRGFGEFDTMTILELPDNISVQAVSAFLQSMAGHASHRVTPLLTDDEFVRAVGQASSLGNAPPV